MRGFPLVELEFGGDVHGYEFLDEGLGCVGEVDLVDWVCLIVVFTIETSELLVFEVCLGEHPTVGADMHPKTV
jgi:hypothetical protein